MLEKKKPPTHTAWSQHREHGRFREWYKSGHVWLEKDEQGETIGCIFQAMLPRSGDGFMWFFPVGTEPPPPKEPQRPQSGQPAEEEES